MKDSRNQNTVISTHTPDETTIESLDVYDIRILKKIKAILKRGNNAEVRQKTDGTLTVYEVKKSIV